MNWGNRVGIIREGIGGEMRGGNEGDRGGDNRGENAGDNYSSELRATRCGMDLCV